MNASVEAIGTYLPDVVVSNEDLAREFPEWSSEKIEKKIGVRERRYTREGETALDLAQRACEAVLEGRDRAQVDFLLLCTESPDYFLPPNACMLQDRLGLRTSIGALDFNLGCSGYIYGLALAKGLIRAGISRHLLLVMAETYSKHLHPRDRANRTVFGDGAAATMVVADDGPGIGEFVLGTDGRGWNRLIVPAGGMRNRGEPDAGEIVDSAGNVRTPNHLFMDGPEIFNFTIAVVPSLVQEVLRVNGLAPEEIDLFVFHQANRYMLEHLRKKIGVPEERFFLDMLATGNTVSATIPIALHGLLASGAVKAGDRLLLAGFGVGYSWGGVVLQV